MCGDRTNVWCIKMWTSKFLSLLIIAAILRRVTSHKHVGLRDKGHTHPYTSTPRSTGCTFYPRGDSTKFVMIPEDLDVGEEVFRVEIHPRKNLNLQPVDKTDDVHHFTYRDVNRTHVAVVLAQSVKLLNKEKAQSVLKFRMACDYDSGPDTLSSFLAVTVYVEDINDHAPEFIGAPYYVNVDELTPVGLTVFKNIYAVDRDKPNTPNSDIQYNIIAGDPKGHFELHTGPKTSLVLKKTLDYDYGERDFQLIVSASDGGSPPHSSIATVFVTVTDNDDLPPKFTQDVYKTKINESYPFTGQRIFKELVFERPISATDQDTGINAQIRYELDSEYPQFHFRIHPENGSIFQLEQIDLDAETGLADNTIVLHIKAFQQSKPLRVANARVEVEILDLNDNMPEFEVDFYNISIVENLPNGFSVLQVLARDKDQGSNGEFTYELSDPYGAFFIDPRTGWLTVRNQTVLDRETHSKFQMKVYAIEKNPSVMENHHNSHTRTGKYRRHTTTRPETKNKTMYIFPDRSGNRNKDSEQDLDRLHSYVTVEVTLLDANDNNPAFIPINLYEFTINTDTKVGSVIGKVKAVDPDLEGNGMVYYDIQSTSNLTITSPFKVNARTGTITLAHTPIEEGRHALFIEASDDPVNPSERRKALAVVSIDVLSVNDGSYSEPPDFIGAPYEFWIGSNVDVGTSVGQIKINSGWDQRQVTFDLLHSYENGVPFAVEELTGVISVVKKMAKYKRPSYDFDAVAMQHNINLTMTTTATIHVVDLHNKKSVLSMETLSPLEFHVKENVKGAVIGKLRNTNYLATPQNMGHIKYTIANEEDIADDISIAGDGRIIANQALDREKREVYRLTVIAEGAMVGAGIYQITIYVEDENDNAPLFELPSYEGYIAENSKNGTVVNTSTRIRARDADAGPNAMFFYTLFGEGRELFTINETTGTVTYIGSELDREKKSSYLLKIVARDKGNLSSETKLTIIVGDENDFIPKFQHITIPMDKKVELLEASKNAPVKIYTEKKNITGAVINEVVEPKIQLPEEAIEPLFAVPESMSIGSAILKVKAIDMDIGSNSQIKYEFVSEILIPPLYASQLTSYNVKRYFVINELLGYIIVARKLPSQSEFRLNISAVDGGGLSDSLSMRILVRDENDHFPVFKKPWYSFNIEEAKHSRRVLGKIVATDEDFGCNGNITYYLQPASKDLPFEISPETGVLSVNGELDREQEEKYILTVVAQDNGQNKKLSSSVSVEVTVLDVNDNPPKFYGYDELLEWKNPDSPLVSNHNYFESATMMPIFRETVAENIPIGSVIAKLYANDSDISGNGNGLVFYTLPHKKNQANIFTIDSKEGFITTLTTLDFETQPTYNITVTASDLGSPSLTSTAIVMLTLTDVPEEGDKKPIFISNYYELEVEENVNPPLELLTVNLTEHYDKNRVKYFILNANDSTINETFAIDPKNGTLYLIMSPDREIQDTYEIIVRCEPQKTSRQLPHIIYPVGDDVLEGMTKNDAKVIVKVKDVNDNAPKFVNGGRPVVTAIPTAADFGYQVITLYATDADIDLNADIRYQIINDQSQRFAIDAITGQVRAVSSFDKDHGKVFGFDVKATDKKGADDGKSAIANVFVYVLDANNELVLTVGAKPVEVEKDMKNITQSLADISGYDVRVRKLEANSKAALDGDATDVYIYAVDPLSNTIINMDMLQKSLLRRETDLRHELSGYRVLEVGDMTMAQARIGRSLSTVEISIVALGCLVFLGAFTTAVSILCVKNSRRRYYYYRRRPTKPFSQRRLKAFANDHLSKYGGLFPSGGHQCQELNQSYSEADSYADVINQGHSTAQMICTAHGTTPEEFGKAHQKCVKNQYDNGTDSDAINGNPKHERLCIKFNQQSSNNGLRKAPETSVISFNSSGQDSGIAEANRCPCGQSMLHTSEASSGCSYEDSLKSNHNQIEFRPKTFHAEISNFKRRASFDHLPLDHRQFNYRRQSFSENIQRHFPPFERIGSTGRMTRQFSTPNVDLLPTQPYIIHNKKNLRRKELREPVVDYDQSDGEDMFNFRINNRLPANKPLRKAKLMEIGTPAVFVATSAAAEIMRRQGSERIMFARPL